MVDYTLMPKVVSLPVKGVISSYRYQPDWFGVHYHVNMYVGCGFGCLACASQGQYSHHVGSSCDTVGVKENAYALLEKAVSGKRRKGVVMLGHESDPYPHIEASYQLTREAIRILLDKQFDVVVFTKSPLVTRDIDLLSAARNGLRPMVVMQIATLSEATAAKIEPGASAPQARLEALRLLANSGIPVGVYLGPLLPFINDDEKDVGDLIHSVAQLGCTFVAIDYKIMLSQQQWELFKMLSSAHFPGMYKKYQEHYAQDYCLALPKAAQLQQSVQKCCDTLGLRYRMSEIESIRGRL